MKEDMPRPRRSTLFSLLSMSLLAAMSACASAHPYWSGTDDFLGELPCDTTKAGVEAIVYKYQGLELQEISYLPPWDLVAVKNGTSIYLNFEGGGLRQVKVTWIDAILHSRSLGPKNLCLAQDHAQSP